MHEHSFGEFAVTILTGGLGLRVSSALIRTMPKPRPTDSRWYEWIYDALQAICDNQDLKGSRELQTSVKRMGE
jgi:hypothetical protein